MTTLEATIETVRAKPDDDRDDRDRAILELAGACDRMEKMLNPRILRMHLENGSLELGIDGKGMAQIFAHCFWDILTETKAENYVTLTFERDEREIEVIVQKRAAKTAHELRREAEAERDQLRLEVARLSAPQGPTPQRTAGANELPKCRAEYKPDKITFLCSLGTGHRGDHANFFHQWPLTTEEREALPCLCTIGGSREHCPRHRSGPVVHVAAALAAGVRACYAAMIDGNVPDGTDDYEAGDNAMMAEVLKKLGITWDDLRRSGEAPAAPRYVPEGTDGVE